MTEKTCPTCGRQFSPLHELQKYCSDECYGAARIGYNQPPTPKNGGKRPNMQTLCWRCRHAVPRIENGRYVRGCSWSIQLKPVDGWTATPVKKHENTCQEMRTWRVLACPNFAPDRDEDRLFPSGHTSDDAYVRIAERVLKMALRSYEAALASGNMGRIRSIESYLRSSYYQALTLGAWDVEGYILGMREKYGVEIEEDDEICGTASKSHHT